MKEQKPGLSWFTDVDNKDPNSAIAYLDKAGEHRAIQAYKDAVFRSLEIMPGESILDVGCGTGQDIGRFFTEIPEIRTIAGIDSSQQMLKYASSRLAPGKAVFIRGDAHSLPFNDNTFDASYSDRTFQHIKDPKLALREMLRVTKPGGRIVVADPDWKNLQITGVSKEVEAIVKQVYLTIIRNEHIGRDLSKLFQTEGINADTAQMKIDLNGLKEIQDILALEASVNKAVEAGVISEDRASHCMETLKTADNMDSLSVSLNILIHKAKKHQSF